MASVSLMLLAAIPAAAATNDFSVSVNPTSAALQPGSATTASVSTAVTAGSAQTISLSASGLPSGVSASFSPASVTAGQSSTLTLVETSSAASSSSTVTITATAASGSHTATVALTVTGPSGPPAVNTPSELCSLTQHYVDGSASYTTLPQSFRDAIDRQVSSVCANLNGVWATLTPGQKQLAVGAYKATVDWLARYGLLTNAQAAELKADASGLLS